MNQNLKVLALFSLISIGTSGFAHAQTAAGDQHWDNQFGLPGVNGSVVVLATQGSNVYAGGTLFSTIGNVVAANIAKWDGQTWTPLGSGIAGGSQPLVHALAFGANGDVYAGGLFTAAGTAAATNIAQWDGTNWSALGGGVSTPITTMTTDGNNNVYVGGHFPNAGGVTVTNVARWDGTNWSNIGALTVADPSAIGTDNAYTLAMGPTGKLLAGGYFSKAGSSGVQSLAQWDGTNWSPWEASNNGMSAGIYAFAPGASTLYAGGLFYTAGRTVANQVAAWDGTNWSALGAGVVGKVPLTGRVTALALNGSDVYMGGSFTNVGGVTVNNVAHWNGTSWSALGTGLNNTVAALAVNGANVYAGGTFTTAGGNPANRIAQWSGSSWSALGTGMNGTVAALLQGSDGLYAGGSFTTAGGSNATYIARWDGANWNALGSGLSGGSGVNAIAISGSTVYVGGTFTTAGGASASMVAQWNGSAWSSLGTGIQGTGVSALAVVGNRLYVGGNFTKAGGISATNVACWDGSAWTALGSGAGTMGFVQALAFWNNVLYVGGGFQKAGQKPAYCVSVWNDQTNFLPATTLQLNPPVANGSQMQMQLSASGGANCVLESTTNFVTWTPVFTNYVGAVNFNAPANSSPELFYRMRQIP